MGWVMGSAIGAGLVTGLLEALWLWFNQAVRGRIIFTSDYILWMTPLLYALLFAALGAGIAVIALVLFPRFRPAYAVFFFTAAGVACLFIPITQIARWAAAIVALGVATQAARVANDRPPVFLRGFRRALGALAGVAIACQAYAVFSREAPRTGPVARADLPDIVLIVWDTVRSENLSLYGYEEPTTPHLERLAEASAVFERAISPSPWTLPTHASMFTGRWPHEMSTGWLERLDAEYPTLAEALAASGYATGGFTANHHYTSYDSGLDRGFAEFGDYRITWRQFLRSSWLTQTRTVEGLLVSRSLSDVWRALRMMDFWVGVKRANHRKHAETVNEEFFAWADGVEDRPLFGFLNYFDAHAAYWSPPGTEDRFGTEHRGMRAYDAAISYLDEQVMALVDGLRERGRLDNTIVVVTSDHGELFGENGLNGHAHNLYYRVLHVPLIFYAPGRFAQGARIDAEVTLRDLPATLLRMAGVEDRWGFGGSSLAPHWEAPRPVEPAPAAPAGLERAALAAASETALLPPSEAALRDAARAAPSHTPLLAEVEQGRNNDPSEPISRGPMKAIVSQGLHYILNGDGEEELYDYLADPREERDLASDPAYRESLERLRAALAAWQVPTPE